MPPLALLPAPLQIVCERCSEPTFKRLARARREWKKRRLSLILRPRHRTGLAGGVNKPARSQRGRA